jgi:hypothetical protein
MRPSWIISSVTMELVFCVSKTDCASLIRCDLDMAVHDAYKCCSFQSMKYRRPALFSHGSLSERILFTSLLLSHFDSVIVMLTNEL